VVVLPLGLEKLVAIGTKAAILQALNEKTDSNGFLR
jgi:hypothetical protein